MVWIVFVRFRKYYNLWAYDKGTICDKFVNRKVPLMQIDEKFTFYANIIEELQHTPNFLDVECMRINLRPLVDTICHHAQEWITTLGEKLAISTAAAIDVIRNDINVSCYFNIRHIPIILQMQSRHIIYIQETHKLILKTRVQENVLTQISNILFTYQINLLRIVSHY